MENEPIIESPVVNTIAFNPPIEVNPNIIAGGMVVNTADVVPQDDPTQVVANIYGDGRVIGVPFVDSDENSIRIALI